MAEFVDAVEARVSATWRDYYELTKPKVVALLVFTAIVGMVLAAPPAQVPWNALIFGSIGIALASAAAAAINQMVDRQVDARMARTSGRPLPQGVIDTPHAVVFAGGIGLLGLGMLWWLVNPLTAWLTFLSLIGYAFIYTLYLKRATPQNIVIGGAAGAAPPVLGWTAVTNSIDPHALLLFLIIFVWTPPHFWALAIHRREEYAEVNIPMLPVTHGVVFTQVQILLYTVLLVAVSLLPFALQMAGMMYLVGVMALNAGFLYYAIKLRWSADASIPMKAFGYSITYLMGVFGLLLLDHYLPLVQLLWS
ncbi:protoheme IX farnesyltransferase [Natronocella acetinitrilica]|uniref:Protoheme IX farnesyltransferase n=1 Tax=Natronocella acetinitrilica TaxID=414046 RepID=A0AAE3G3X8_9GAMM|nr:protoheme IX farnesyltransferase [Natronocella acetinitrilica]